MRAEGLDVGSEAALSASSEDAVLEAPALRAESEWQRARDTEGVVCQTHIGGQALLEGIMMRGRYNWAIAVRRPDGSIYTEEHDLISGREQNSWMYKPVIRGCTALVESLALGYQALSVASENAFMDEGEEGLGEADGPGLGQDGQGGEGEASASGLAAAGPAAGCSTDAVDRLAAGGSPADTDDSSDAVSDTDEDNSADTAGSTATGSISDAADGIAVDSIAVGSPDDAGGNTAAGSPDDAAGNTATGSPAAPDSAPADAPTTAPAKEPAAEDGSLPKSLITFSMILGMLLGVGLFVALPAFLTNLLVGDYAEHTLLWNLVDGVIRITLFVFYIWLIGKMSDIGRMFGYHGAEHKTIHCYEHGLDLTVANADLFPTLHVRCGTAFMLMTMLIAILVFTLTPIGPLIDALGVTNAALRLLLVVASRIVLIPLIGGLSYEITVKWAGSRPDNPLVQGVLWPGMQLQRLTTRQPDEGQLQCAIAAMQLVLDREQREAASGNTLDNA